MTDVAERRKRGQDKAGGWGETIRTVVYAVLIALVVRTFAIEPFNIPSGSMIPTLLVGDYLFVSKYSYGYSKHSFPFSMVLFSGRIFGQPRRLAGKPTGPDVARFLRVHARPRPAGLVRSRREPGRARRIHLLLARSVGRRLAGAVEMAAGHPMESILHGHPLKPSDVDL